VKVGEEEEFRVEEMINNEELLPKFRFGVRLALIQTG
jgi:hypothetical protein